jgi:hypothetical protein
MDTGLTRINSVRLLKQLELQDPVQQRSIRLTLRGRIIGALINPEMVRCMAAHLLVLGMCLMRNDYGISVVVVMMHKRHRLSGSRSDSRQGNHSFNFDVESIIFGRPSTIVVTTVWMV